MNFPPITLGVIWSSIKAQQLITTLKSIFSWKNKSGKVLSFRFVSMQNDQIEKNYLCNHLHLLYTLVYKCSYRIPWCYYKPHQNYNCGFLCHTHRCLKSYLSVIETQYAFCVFKTFSPKYLQCNQERRLLEGNDSIYLVASPKKLASNPEPDCQDIDFYCFVFLFFFTSTDKLLNLISHDIFNKRLWLYPQFYVPTETLFS